jgi:hypothetical protein
MKITKTYNNPNNNGKELVQRDGDKFFVASDWGNGFGQKQEVSRSDIKLTMEYTSAPAEVVAAILMQND